MKKLFARRKFSKFDLVMNAVILLFAVSNLFPLYWLYSNSFKYSPNIAVMPPQWIPATPTLHNFQTLFRDNAAFSWLGSSVLISAATTALVVLVSALAAYSFAKLRFPGRDLLFIIFISTLMLPKEVFIVPLFKTVNYMGLYGTYPGIVLPNVALPFGVFLLKQFFESIPDSLRESAKIDGSNEYRTFLSIVLPISKPGIGALAILMFVQTWNDYLWQLIMISKNEMKTLQMAIAAMQSNDQVDYGLRYAGAALCALPMLAIFIAFQKYFTRGITLGAVKE